jgi:hypothetical protein
LRMGPQANLRSNAKSTMNTMMAAADWKIVPAKGETASSSAACTAGRSAPAPRLQTCIS